MLGAAELIIIAVAFLLLFGPDKIPKIAKDFGRAWGELRKFQDELAIEVNAGTEGLNLGNLGLDGGAQTQKKTAPVRDPISTASSFKLKQMARKLGVDTRDMKDTQIIDAINLQMVKLSAKEDGRAMFRELQDKEREKRKSSIDRERIERKKKQLDMKSGKKPETKKQEPKEKTTVKPETKKQEPKEKTTVKPETKKQEPKEETVEITKKQTGKTSTDTKVSVKGEPETTVVKKSGKPTGKKEQTIKGSE
jgi:TatA/E family protein of Tat protein translocase